MNEIYSERRIRILHKLINQCKPKNKIIYDLGASSTNAISNGIISKKIIKFDIMSDKYPDILIDLNEKIPAQNDSADICIAGELIEHLYYANNFLKETKRVLKKGGYLILTVPNACSIKYRIMMLFGILGSNLAKADEQNKYAQIRKGDGHVRDFNKKEISTLLRKNNFKIEKICTIGTRFKFIFIPGEFVTSSFGDDIIIKAVVNK